MIFYYVLLYNTIGIKDDLYTGATVLIISVAKQLMSLFSFIEHGRVFPLWK